MAPKPRRFSARSVLFFTIVLVATLSLLLLLYRIATTHAVGGGFIGPVRDHDFIVEGHTIGDNFVDDHIPQNVQFQAPPRYTEFQLLEKYQYTDLVYTWVDGNNFISKLNKFMLWNQMPNMKETGWRPGDGILSLPKVLGNAGANQRDRDSGELMFSFRGREAHMKWHHGRIIVVSPGETPEFVDKLKLFRSQRRDWTPTIFEKRKKSNAAQTRYVQNFIQRLKMIGKARRPPQRLIVTHQDAVLPEGESRVTFNSNTIEAHIFRIPHLTEMFFQFNDDYMIGKRTTVSDFVSRLGGPVLRFENNKMNGGARERDNLLKNKPGMTWLIGIYNTNAKIRDMLEASNEKNTDVQGGIHNSVMGALGGEVDNNTQTEWATRYFIKHAPFVYCKKVLEYVFAANMRDISVAGKWNKGRAATDIYIPFAHHAVALEAPWRGVEVRGNAPSFYDTVGVGGADTGNEPKGLQDRGAKGYKLLLEDQTYRKHATHDSEGLKEERTFPLTPEVSCGPAYGLFGDPQNNQGGALFMIKDNLRENEMAFTQIRRLPPLFFTLNDMFNTKDAGDQMQTFLEEYYPKPSQFEEKKWDLNHHPKNEAALIREVSADADLLNAFFGRPINLTMDQVRQHGGTIPNTTPKPKEGRQSNGHHEFEDMPDTTPLVITLSDLEYICPCLRSIQFALPLYNGPIHFVALEDGLRNMNQDYDGPWAEDVPVDFIGNQNYENTKEPHVEVDYNAKPTGKEKVYPYKTGHPRATMDTPHGTRSGLDGPPMGWLPPCHINEEKVEILIFKGQSKRGNLEAKYAERFFTPKDKEEFASDVKKEVLDYIWVHGQNPVFGQTVSVEDFHFRSAAPVNRDQIGDHSLGIEHIVVGELDATDEGLATIDCVSASSCLLSYKLPYAKYERIV